MSLIFFIIKPFQKPSCLTCYRCYTPHIIITLTLCYRLTLLLLLFFPWSSNLLVASLYLIFLIIGFCSSCFTTCFDPAACSTIHHHDQEEEQRSRNGGSDNVQWLNNAIFRPSKTTKIKQKSQTHQSIKQTHQSIQNSNQINSYVRRFHSFIHSFIVYIYIYTNVIRICVGRSK